MPDLQASLDHPSSTDENVYNVYAVRYARQAGRSARDTFLPSPIAGGDMHDGPLPSCYYIWIVHNRHRTIVVDSGISPRAGALRGRALDIDPIEALSRLGIDPDQVHDVVLTHLHFDHASNIDRFGQARFHVQQTEAGYVTGPCMCHPFLRAPFDIEDVVTLMRRLYADRVVFHDGEGAPFPGVTLHILPGHSPGIQAVRVNTPRGPVVLASDVTHFYTNLLERRPFRVTVDVAATLRSFDRLACLAGSVDRVIPGHDPKVRQIYPRYQVNGVEVIALHEPPSTADAADLVGIDID